MIAHASADDLEAAALAVQATVTVVGCALDRRKADRARRAQAYVRELVAKRGWTRQIERQAQAIVYSAITQCASEIIYAD